MSAPSVSKWAQRFDREGLDGLKDHERLESGRSKAGAGIDPCRLRRRRGGPCRERTTPAADYTVVATGAWARHPVEYVVLNAVTIPLVLLLAVLVRDVRALGVNA